MASDANIALVQQNLPSWREELPVLPWDVTQIGLALDANGGNVLAAVRMFWVQRVSDTQPLVDVRDANSSRPLSQDYEQARQMLAYWDSYIEMGHGTRMGKIKKRYKNRNRGGTVGIDSYGYGSPYVRTD